MHRLFLPEVFEKLATIENLDDQVAFIKGQNNLAILYAFDYSFNPKWVFDVEIPEKYKTSDAPLGLADINLFAEMRKLYVYTTSCPATAKRKKEMLHSLLEFISKPEAKFVVDIISGEFKKYKNVTPRLAKTLIPQLPFVLPEDVGPLTPPPNPVELPSGQPVQPAPVPLLPEDYWLPKKPEKKKRDNNGKFVKSKK